MPRYRFDLRMMFREVYDWEAAVQVQVQEEQRNGIRWLVSPELRARVQSGGKTLDCEVLDIGPGGCQLRYENGTAVLDQPVEVVFFAGQKRTSPQRSRFVERAASPAAAASLRFENEVRYEHWGWCQQFVVGPKTDPMTRRTLHRLQEQLALSDIRLIEGNVRDIKSRQFQMLISVLPILVGLLGASYSFAFKPGAEGSGSAAPFPWWVSLLPITCLLLAVPFFGVFLQKCASLARQESFVLLIQRYLATGCFPFGYRGWHDANANLNHMNRFGLSKDSKLHIRPLQQPSMLAASAIPSNTFRVFMTLVFTVIPFLAVVATFMLAVRLQPSMGLFAAVVMVSTGLLAVCFGWFAWYGVQVVRGKRSFRYCMSVFEKVLQYCGPYDPRSLEKL